MEKTRFDSKELQRYAMAVIEGIYEFREDLPGTVCSRCRSDNVGIKWGRWNCCDCAASGRIFLSVSNDPTGNDPMSANPPPRLENKKNEERIEIATSVEREIWVSMFNAAVRSLVDRSPSPDEAISFATKVADDGLRALRLDRIIMGSKADDFTRINPV